LFSVLSIASIFTNQLTPALAGGRGMNEIIVLALAKIYRSAEYTPSLWHNYITTTLSDIFNLQHKCPCDTIAREHG
jgi:hypothetical protein